MKFIDKTFLLLLFYSFTLAQTQVDKVTQQLEFLSSLTYNDWKMSGDLTKTKIIGDPAKKEFDDSQWVNLKLDERVYPDSCWLRKVIVIPEKFLGKPISGKIKLLVSVDDYGYMFINGESKGYFPWDGEFVLSENVKPGEKFIVAIKAINTGGPLRLIRAQLDAGGADGIQQKIMDFALSLKVGQKLLSFDTYQTNSSAKVDPGIDKSSVSREEKIKLNKLLQEQAGKLPIGKLESGNIEEFEKSFQEVRKALKPVSDYAKQFTVSFASNAHIDAAWLWRWKETIEVCHNTFNSVFNIMEAKPDFTYTQSAAAYYDWMEKLYPDVYQKIKDKIKDGRWEVIGGMWIEPDCNLIGGESWMRQILYAKKYFKEKLGQDVKIGWNPDSFGYNWNMPMFYQNSGIDAFITQKISWNETNVFPYRAFWWESPDGSRILTYFPFDYVNTITQSFQFIDWLRQYESNTGFKKLMVLFGVGDHGGGPTMEMIDRIEHLRSLDIYPTIEYCTAGKYIKWLKSQDISSLPVWKNELYLEYHQGTFTTQAKNKECNRKSEVLLTNAEKFSSIAKLYGVNYPQNDFRNAWKKTLFNQFHDILPGSGIREVYIDSKEDYDEVDKIGRNNIQKAIDYICARIKTDKFKCATPVVIFNPLNWKRSELVTLKIDYPVHKNYYFLYDENMKDITYDVKKIDYNSNEIVFMAENIPPIGYKTYFLYYNNCETAIDMDFITVLEYENTDYKIENDFYKIQIDPKSGWIKSIFDKRFNKEILNGNGNELQFLEDKPIAWDAWNIGLTGVKYSSTFRKSEVIEDGEVRMILRLYRDFLKPGVVKDLPTPNFPSSFFTQDIILYKGLDRIDFKTDVDWWEDKTMLKVAFPLSFSDSVATYEIPCGTITRSTGNTTTFEKAQYEVPAIRWADVSSGNYGVSLINNSKYGYDIKGNVMRLSLLRSPKWPDPTADRGKHSIEYSLYPHKGNWKEADVVKKGYEFNYPLIVVVNTMHNGELPPSKSFVQLDADNLILTQIKKAEDSDAFIIQWYEAEGRDTEAKLILPVAPNKVFLSNFLEEEKEQLSFEKNLVTIPTKKNEVKTVKVFF